MSITINNADDIAGMRIAGRLGSEVLDYITPFVVQGVTTGALDTLCHDYIVNVQQITRIDPYEKDSHVAILRSGVKVPVSRSGYGKLKEVLGL